MKTDVKHMALNIVAALFIVSCGDDVDVGVAVGTLERDRIELVAEAFEPVIEILVREGDLVNKGDVSNLSIALRQALERNWDTNKIVEHASRYSWEDNIQNMKEILECAVSKKKSNDGQGVFTK